MQLWRIGPSLAKPRSRMGWQLRFSLDGCSLPNLDFRVPGTRSHRGRQYGMIFHVHRRLRMAFQFLDEVSGSPAVKVEQAIRRSCSEDVAVRRCWKANVKAGDVVPLKPLNRMSIIVSLLTHPFSVELVWRFAGEYGNISSTGLCQEVISSRVPLDASTSVALLINLIR